MRFQSLIVASMAILAVACTGGKGSSTGADASHGGMALHKGDTLRVGTLYSPTSYFIYRDEVMGYDYELVKKYAESRGFVLEMVVEHNMTDLLQKLCGDSIDLISYSVPCIADYKMDVDYCGPSVIDYQVLVQMKSDSVMTDVSQLIDKEITVEKGSKYESRLRNLDEELGGGLKINAIQRDTLTADEMIRMAANGEISLTVVDSRTATLNTPYYPMLDMKLKISLDQKGSWAVKKGNTSLMEDVDEWWEKQHADSTDIALYKKYYEESLVPEMELLAAQPGQLLGGGKISHYDDSFRRHAAIPGWDWRLLAAVGWTESHFTPTIRSGAGARGIMQLMPRTAANFGVKGDQIENPDANIMAGAKLIKLMDDDFRSRGVENPSEREKFVLAAYNAGQGHIYDAMALAKKYGRNQHVWEGNVRDCVLMKSKEQYYNDPVVKCGYFNGTQTVSFVDNVLATYRLYKAKI